MEINLQNDILKVDGNLAIAWSGSLDFTVEQEMCPCFFQSRVYSLFKVELGKSNNVQSPTSH